VLFNAIRFPVLFKIEPAKARLFTIAIPMIFSLGVIALTPMVTEYPTDMVSEVATNFPSVMAMAVLGCLVITVVSCLLSIKFYETREF
jgi:hypothetical protein